MKYTIQATSDMGKTHKLTIELNDRAVGTRLLSVDRFADNIDSADVESVSHLQTIIAQLVRANGTRVEATPSEMTLREQAIEAYAKKSKDALDYLLRRIKDTTGFDGKVVDRIVYVEGIQISSDADKPYQIFGMVDGTWFPIKEQADLGRLFVLKDRCDQIDTAKMR